MTPAHQSRRQFLETCGAAALLTAHGALAQNPPAPQPSRAPKNGAASIASLELLSAVPLATMKAFYHESLGLQVIEDQPNRLTVAAGLTHLTFIFAPPGEASPFYHFAFNIPESKIVSALEWQQQRSAIIPVPEGLRDSAYPDEVVSYRHWNAHSIFFFDPAQNVVEYIARHDLPNAAAGAFTSRDILYASEIAFIVDDVPNVASKLAEAVGVSPYGKPGELFTALGDEHGLLLVMKRGRLLSLASPHKKEAGVYRTAAVVSGIRAQQHIISGFPYEITVKA